MVKQEIIFWRYLWKTQYIFLTLPLIFVFFAIIMIRYNGEVSNNLLNFVVFPILLLPIIALLYQVGSIHQKELLLTYPLNNLIFGWVRPIFLSVIYSLIFTGALGLTNGYTNEQLKGAFIASILYMIMAGFFLVLFKNVALGIVIPLGFLFYGIFTTGSGIGGFYLMQWGRANPDISIYNCMIAQGIATIVLSYWTLYFLKMRNKYHWFD